MSTAYQLKASVKDHPNLRKIWGDLYKVRVPLVYTMSDDEIRTRGLPTTGDEKIDKMMHNNPTISYMTIDKIFETYRLGATISVVDYDDTKLIYEAIQGHLEEWLRFMQHGIHLHAVPFDDLLDLDAFASVVYDKAKYIFNPAAVRGINTAWNDLGIDLSPNVFFNKRGSVRFFHLLKSENDKATEQGHDNRHHLQRSSFSDELMRMADKFDTRPQKKAVNGLRFGNDREWK